MAETAETKGGGSKDSPQYYLTQSNKWARELSKKSSFSKGMNWSEIEENRAYNYIMYELRSRGVKKRER